MINTDKRLNYKYDDKVNSKIYFHFQIFVR